MKEIIIPLGTIQKVLVKATKDDMADSDIGEYEYTVLEGKVATPVIVPDEVTQGKFTLTCATSGASIYYTIDGSTPDNTDTLYTDAVTLEATATVKAIAYKTDWAPSAVASQDIVVSESYSYTNTEAETYANALTTAPDDTDAAALDTFVGALKTAGVFTKLDNLKLLANWDKTGAVGENSTCLINLIDPTKHKGSVIGTGGVTHTQYTGCYGGGTAGINEGFNPTTSGIKATQNKCMFGVWIQNAYNEVQKFQIGGRVGANGKGYAIARAWTSSVHETNMAVKINNAFLFPLKNYTTGLLAAIRSASNVWNISSNDTYADEAGTNLSSATEDANIYVLCTHSSGVAASFCKDTIALSFEGQSLDETEWGYFYSACNTFLTHLFGRAS